MTAAESSLIRGDEGSLDRRDLSWWGMALFIITEGTLFAYLIASYFYVGSSNPAWPPIVPEIRITAINTALLIISSGCAIMADRSIKRGRTRLLSAWLGVTILLGVIFLALQMHEYTTLTFRPQTDAYGSLFYLITGLHGAHVAAGLLMLLYVLVRALAGHFNAVRHFAVRNAILYWHFVDVVWIVVFTSLYVLPRIQ